MKEYIEFYSLMDLKNIKIKVTEIKSVTSIRFNKSLVTSIMTWAPGGKFDTYIVDGDFFTNIQKISKAIDEYNDKK